MLLGLARPDSSRTAGGGRRRRADGRKQGRTRAAYAGLVMMMHQTVAVAAVVAVRGRVRVRVCARRGWLSFTAPNRAKDEPSTRQERPAQQ